MIPDTLTSWTASPAGGICALGLGWAAGLLLCRAVDGWYRATDDERVPRRAGVLIAMGAACVTGLLWWWEIGHSGMGRLVAGSEVLPRYLHHAALFWLLAAATWIDLRQRVIPDWITVPGVIVGLAAAWAWPTNLLPITVEVARSFAAPALEPDVLAWYGGLHAGSGGMFGGRPQFPGLVLATALYAAWWLVCTEPAEGERGMFRLSLRNALLVVGVLAIGAAWWAGGTRFASLQTALIGMTVSGGLVWAVRAGASAALGQEAMGLGDVTLMAMLGAWLGWQACVLTFFLAAFIGLGHGLVQLIRHRENELPFGPSLCLAAAVVAVGWRSLWRTTRVHFEEPAQLALVVATVVVLTAITLSAWRWLRSRG